MSDQRDISQREIDVARDKANAGGPAQSYARVRTNFRGSRIVHKRIDFGCTFTQKPWVAYGTEIDLDAVEDALDTLQGEGLGVGSTEFDFADLPQCTGYVNDWDTDSHDHYTGCWVCVQVTYPTNLTTGGEGGTTNVKIPLVHHFTFAALALKDVSDSAADLTPTEDPQG